MPPRNARPHAVGTTDSWTVRQKVRVAYVIVFLDMLGVGILIPLLPKLAKSLGAGPTMVGLLSSLYGALNLVGGPLMGRVSDVYGRRVALMVALIGAGSGYLGLGFVSSVGMLVACRIPTGVFKQSMTIAKAYVSELTSEEERAATIAQLNVCSALAFMIGPACGGYIASLPNGYQSAALLAGALFALDAVYVWFTVEPAVANSLGNSSSHKPKHSDSGGMLPALKHIASVVSREHLGVVVVVRFLLGTGVMIFRSTLSSLLEFRLDLDTRTFGILISYVSAITMVSSLGVGRLVKYAGSEIPLLLPGIALTLASMAVVTVADSVALIAIAMIPMAAAGAVLRACNASLISKACPKDELGVVMGAAESVMSLGRMAAPTIGGLALAQSSYGPLAVCSICCIAAGAGVLFGLRPHPTHALKAKAT